MIVGLILTVIGSLGIKLADFNTTFFWLSLVVCGIGLYIALINIWKIDNAKKILLKHNEGPHL